MSYPSLCGFVKNDEYFGHLDESFEVLKPILICVTLEESKKNEFVSQKVLVQDFSFSSQSFKDSFVLEIHSAMRGFRQVV